MNQNQFLFSLAIILCLTGNGLAQDTNIYHTNWIDLNKNGKMDIYEDASQPVAQRVADLMSQMTIAEKAGQLEQGLLNPDQQVANLAAAARGDLSSTIYVREPEATELAYRNDLQRASIETSRLGIPQICGYDSIHGFRTIFPIPLGFSCSWEPALLEKSQAISARESAAAGIDWVFSPMVDIARDARWGRVAEGFGEDPWLDGQYAAAATHGFQGDKLADLKNPDRVLACLKHYAGYGAAESGRDYNTTEITEFTLRNYYLPQYKAAIDAGALTIMSAFNTIGGTPCTANHHLLTGILHDEWNFGGFLVCDWGAVKELLYHGVAADDADCARIALNAGVDMEMMSTTYREQLPSLLKSGEVTAATMDESVRRILTVKFEKGLFDRPYSDPSLLQNAFLQPDAIALAREAAAKSCVLLKNDNAVLPLSTAVKQVALIGPLADDKGNMLGTWSAAGKPEDAVTLAKGLRDALPADVNLTVVKGCKIIEGQGFTAQEDGSLKADDKPAQTTEDHEIQAAVEAAKKADVVIMALGEPGSWTGENASRSTLGLPDRQQELFDAISVLGKPVVVVLFNGRPLTIENLQNKATAILEAWHGGVQAGNGVADVLTGKVNPSGRLTVTFPRTLGQVPVYYNHLNTGHPQAQIHYLDGTMAPLYPFGYGLSYTTFAISEAKLGASEMPVTGNVTITATVTNTGNREGDEVAQLYIRQLVASAGSRPVRELRGFQKVHLAAGEKSSVTFTVDAKTLGYYNDAGQWLCDAGKYGKYNLWISADSSSGEPVSLQVQP